MRTTVDLDRKLVEDLCRVTGEKSLNKAVNMALSEFVRRRKLEMLRESIGKMGLDLDWRVQEDAELAEMERER